MSVLELAGLPTGEAIRKWLSIVGEGNPYSFYQLYSQVKPTTSYDSVRRYFWILKEIGLIEPVRYAPARTGFRKHFYRLVADKTEDPAWWHPQGELYEATLLGATGYESLRKAGLRPKGGRSRKYQKS